MSRTHTTIAALVLLGALLAGCSATGDETVFAPATTKAPPPTTEAPALPPTQDCQNNDVDELRSYQPTEGLPSPGRMPANSYMAKIHDRGRLIAGVSADTLLFGARNPIENRLEGFDIDMVKRVALAIFGGELADVDQYIEYRVIRYDQRIPSLQDGSVDIVAHTMTINCTRWQQIAFSSQYYASGQKVLVRKGSGITDVLQLGGQTVCVASGSTNLDNINDKKDETDPPIDVEEVPDLTDCLVKFQQGDVQAITGDDTVLAGFAAQDPYAVVVGGPFSKEPYGLGINKDNIDFVKFVNSVLDQLRADGGGWADIYTTWLGEVFEPPVPPPPAALYGRPEP